MISPSVERALRKIIADAPDSVSYMSADDPHDGRGGSVFVDVGWVALDDEEYLAFKAWADGIRRV